MEMKKERGCKGEILLPLKKEWTVLSLLANVPV